MKSFLKKYQANSLIVRFGFLTILAGVGIVFLTHCSSKKETPTKVQQSPTQWDYKTIREKREAESSQNLDSTSENEITESKNLNCRKVTENEMKRAKLSGCRPLDPREGHGVNMFCCTL
jgi:hypothetical protein